MQNGIIMPHKDAVQIDLKEMVPFTSIPIMFTHSTVGGCRLLLVVFGR